MEAKALRNWGLGVGAAAIAGALALAALTGDPKPAPPPDRPVAAAPLPAAPTVAPVAPSVDPVFDAAAADAPPDAEPISFLVRFEGDHPLARAQSLAAQGREAPARRAAEAALAQRRDLSGLCFDRFTVGGVEIVLRTCTPPPAFERDAERRRWLERLQAMPGIAYAEENAAVQPQARP